MWNTPCMNSRTAPSRKRNKKTNKQRASTRQKHAGPRQEALRRHCGPLCSRDRPIPAAPSLPHPCGHTAAPHPAERPSPSPAQRNTSKRRSAERTPTHRTEQPHSPDRLARPTHRNPGTAWGRGPVGTRDPRIALANREGAGQAPQLPEPPAGPHRASLSAPTGYSQRPSPRPLSRGPPAATLRPSCARGHGFLHFPAALSVHPAAPRRRVPWCPHRIRTTYRAAPQPVRVFAALLWVAKLFPGDIYPCLGKS